MLHTDNSAVRMLSVKLGAGRLRHIKGRLLWLQDKVAANELQIKQVKTTHNIADLNTKALNRDRFYCLLYMFGFVVNGEKVGEAEFTRMQTRDLLKQKVRVVSEVVLEKNQAVPGSKLNKIAKQVLRILASCSLMSLAEGENVVTDAVSVGNSLRGDTSEALGHWLPQLSPMTMMCFVCVFMLLLGWVMFMTPDVINGPMFRVEGMLVWMYHRCEARARRNVNRVVNGFRMDTLQQLIRACDCFEEMTESESQHMMDNVVAMTDLTDDETSPRHQMSMDERETEIFQAFQAYQVG